VLERLTSLGAASFLCVIKDCGGEGEGLLSFPKPGTSIAVDIPVRKNAAEVVKKLNELLIPAGGRIYLAKTPSPPPRTSAPWSRGSPPSSPPAAATIPRAS
jgi:hypothetical protein